MVLGDVMDAYRNLAKNLETLKGKGKNEAGLCNFDKGKEYYEYLVRSNVGSDMSIAEIKKTTEEFIDTRMSAIFDTLYDDMELYYMFLNDEPLSTKEPDEIMEELIEKCQKDFGNIPDVNYEIKNVPIAMEEHLNPAFYLTPPIDDSNDNVIYINQKYEDQEDLYPLLAHEGYPGHLCQYLYQRSIEGLGLTQQALTFGGYAEGWAQMAEEWIILEQTRYDQNAAMFAFCNSMLSSAILPSVVSIYVNYYGYERDDVQEYLNQYGLGDAAHADLYFRLAVNAPYGTLRYAIGYAQLSEMMRGMSELLGEAYLQQEVLQQYLDYGPAYFNLIQERMDEWADARVLE